MCYQDNNWDPLKLVILRAMLLGVKEVAMSLGVDQYHAEIEGLILWGGRIGVHHLSLMRVGSCLEKLLVGVIDGVFTLRSSVTEFGSVTHRIQPTAIYLNRLLTGWSGYLGVVCFMSKRDSRRGFRGSDLVWLASTILQSEIRRCRVFGRLDTYSLLGNLTAIC
jgi:hypothetical protein